MAAEEPILAVVAAVIRRENDDVLMAQRLSGGPHGGLWEFPGGKVEEGETGRDALRREIREELGAEVAVGAELCTVSHRYPHVSIRMRVFECRVVGGEPGPVHCQSVVWVPTDRLLDLPMPAADVPIAQLLLRSRTGIPGA